MSLYIFSPSCDYNFIYIYHINTWYAVLLHSFSIFFLKFYWFIYLLERQCDIEGEMEREIILIFVNLNNYGTDFLYVGSLHQNIMNREFPKNLHVHFHRSCDNLNSTQKSVRELIPHENIFNLGDFCSCVRWQVYISIVFQKYQIYAPFSVCLIFSTCVNIIYDNEMYPFKVQCWVSFNKYKH